MSDLPSLVIHRAKEIWFSKRQGATITLEAINNAAMSVDQHGKIKSIGRAAEIKPLNNQHHIVDHGDSILIPGFIDAHIHCPQLDVIGSGGLPLLEWLDRYVFAVEAEFANSDVATRGASRLARELKKNGITTSAVFSSVHAVAAEALFSEFESSGLRLFSGKTSMDVGAPKAVLQNVRADIEDQEALIKRWHGKNDRLFYAITPRFALSCSREMMRALGDLRERHGTCYVQTHISENIYEVAEVKKTWPEVKDYLSVYADHGLLGSKTILAHGIYLSDSELSRIASSKTSIVHCPSSNSFLGSGLFQLQKTVASGTKVCLASDIGAGTGLSPWHTMMDCYKVQALNGMPVTAEELFYRMTLAGAEALGLESKCGNFEVGKEADFVVLKPSNKELLEERLAVSKTTSEKLFACMAHGDDRITESVYVAGSKIYQRQPLSHL